MRNPLYAYAHNPAAEQLICFASYTTQKILHRLIVTTFLSNVVFKYMDNNFLNKIMPWRVGLIV